MVNLSPAAETKGAGMNGFQARMARHALQWRFEDAAKHCGVSVGVIQRIEADDEGVTVRSMRKIKTAYEQAGIEFNADGRGIRMREPPKP
jgi:hypothetical protein